MGEPGFIVTVNGQELVAVSSKGLNLLTFSLDGDVLSEEPASIRLSGGLYGESDEDKHLIWLSEYEVAENDEVQITFSGEVVSSKAGKTIDALCAEESEIMGPWQAMEQVFEHLAQQRRVREQFILELEHSSGAIKRCETKPNEYRFGLNMMWQGLKPESAKIWLSSNTLEGVRDQTNGTQHVRARMKFGEYVKVRVKTLQH